MKPPQKGELYVSYALKGMSTSTLRSWGEVEFDSCYMWGYFFTGNEILIATGRYYVFGEWSGNRISRNNYGKFTGEFIRSNGQVVAVYQDYIERCSDVQGR